MSGQVYKRCNLIKNGSLYPTSGVNKSEYVTYSKIPNII